MSAGGSRGTTCALLVSDEQPGRRAGRLRPAPPGCGRHQAAGCASSACGRDRGATQTSEGAAKPGGGGVFSSGGKAVRWQDSKAGEG